MLGAIVRPARALRIGVKAMTRIRPPLYGRWRKMKARCYDPKQYGYHRYGGRGIGICQEWDQDYSAFEAWAFSSGYRPELQIDRIDNDKGYSPDNCRWVPSKVNANNKSDTIRITVRGESLTLSDAMGRYNLTRRALVHRLKLGLSGEALIAPIAPWRSGDTCKNGHARNDANVAYRKDGEIRCRPCELARDHKRRAK